MYYSKLIMIIVLCFTTLCVDGQKVVYNQGNENWKNNINPEKEYNLMYSVFLIGDTKYPSPNSEVLNLLQSKLNQQSENSALVVLGDIVYQNGLPDSLDQNFQLYADTLDNLLRCIENFKGQIVFTPGNHDWERGKSEGWNRIINLEKHIEKYLGRGNVFLPDKGCPGPVEINLSEDITLIVFDTQWWFHQNEKPNIGNNCEFEDEAGLIAEVTDVLRRNKDKKIIFAAHHPLYSGGNHGGHFPASSLLFPFLEKNENLYIPAPGFIYTSYRKYFGYIQDFAHPQYKLLKDHFLSIFDGFPDLIYAAGHEHNLQYVKKNQLHHIISGGGGESTYITKKENKTDFAAQSTGFSKLNFYDNGDVWVEFIIPDGTDEGKIVFRKKLYNKPIYSESQKKIELSQINYSDSIVKVALSDIYEAGNYRRFWMGDNYREIWNAKVDFPVFDIGTEKGGLSIIKRGGGMQTKSFRLKSTDGKQYVLRSVNKNVELVLPGNLRNTFALDLIQDGISASHPFSAITIPAMADAIGVLHTNPKLVWVPDDPRFGIYQKDLANGVFLFEERPNGNWKDFASFGNSKKIVGTDEVIENINDKHKYKIDQTAILKARLFDILINDWDRHEDQWRWASFKKKEETIYKPIPRDRDQVFFVSEGVIPWLATRKWINPKFQGFDYNIDDLKGLSFNARFFDRSFLNEPGLNDWQQMAKSINEQISDSIIHKAIDILPEKVYRHSGKEIEKKLISRKEKLEDYAKEYYLVLAKEVDIIGTNERELFKATRLENGNIDLTVTELSDKKGKEKEQLYKREFKIDETKEIRFYGLNGKDKYIIEGQSKKGIKIRIIGGKGNDSIIDRSKVNGWSKKTLIYDRKDKKNFVEKGPETKLKLSNHKSVNRYNRKQFRNNTAAPVLQLGYNIDDGIYLGGGVFSKIYSFRDSSFQKTYFQYSYETGAFAAYYYGLFSGIAQEFDLLLDIQASLPKNVDNFFGLGNETKRITDDIEYYRVRYKFININPMLQFNLNENINYSFGTFYRYFHVQDTAGRYISELYPETLGSEAYQSHHYAGINANFIIDIRDNKILPKRGILWNTDVSDFFGLDSDANNFVRLKSDLSLYLSFRSDPRVVFAIRAGGAINFGDYEFFQANFIGGKTNVRGLYSNRYAGDQSFYQNTEVRIKLANLSSYVFNGQLGILVFNDIGRVWYKMEQSNVWHRGTGVGLWLTPFDFTVLSATYNFSKEEDSFGFSFQFMF
jgi:hypothetical protein